MINVSRQTPGNPKSFSPKSKDVYVNLPRGQTVSEGEQPAIAVESGMKS